MSRIILPFLFALLILFPCSPSQVQAALPDKPAISDFYKQREGRFYWIAHGRLNGDGEYLAKALSDSWTHGLNPRRYGLEEALIFLKAADEDSQIKADILLTQAFILYARDLSGMRVSPDGMATGRTGWLLPVSPDHVLGLLVSGGRFRSILKSFEPQGKTYASLRKELIRLAGQKEGAQDRLPPVKLSRVIKPGARDRGVPALRERLGIRSVIGDALLYDDELAAAVMRFQRDRGLISDGLVGPDTLDALNLTRTGKMLKIIANMERLRWVPPDRPTRFVTVNIPSATLWAVENGRVTLEMPVVVGTADRPTYSFITTIRGVRFNPGWTVPRTIKAEDIWPKLKENPDYLGDKGMTLYQDGNALDPAAVDWTALTPADLASFQMVQTPGAHNPLGRIRVLMPNQYDIYLHGTNRPDYFEKQDRALSSGCVRLESPDAMAEFILKGEPGWGAGSLAETLAGGKTHDALISKPFPVYIVYYTAWVDERGGIVYGPDLYGQDENLIGKLRRVDGIFIPGHNEPKPG
ncbi:MAG: L,D-transpeptidase family protein [Alphaproteobacteria bacterium]|nr:L,D-transpeptidase family protein [Alphaproteobacteria bacterium]